MCAMRSSAAATGCLDALSQRSLTYLLTYLLATATWENAFHCSHDLRKVATQSLAVASFEVRRYPLGKKGFKTGVDYCVNEICGKGELAREIVLLVCEALGSMVALAPEHCEQLLVLLEMAPEQSFPIPSFIRYFSLAEVFAGACDDPVPHASPPVCQLEMHGFHAWLSEQ